MTLDKLKGKKIYPRSSLVAFKWLKPKLKNKLAIPDIYYDLGLRLGKYYIGEVLAVGPKVREIKPKDKILVAEYGIKDFRGTWKENEVYFIEEKYCKGKIKGYRGLIERRDSEKDYENKV